MAYHHPPHQAKSGLGTAVLFMLFVIVGGGLLATTMEEGPSVARVYLAKDLNAAAVR